jgi:hypothetical protein
MKIFIVWEGGHRAWGEGPSSRLYGCAAQVGSDSVALPLQPQITGVPIKFLTGDGPGLV